MSDLVHRIGELANLMEEFGLSKVRMKGSNWSVEFDAEDPLVLMREESDPGAPAVASRRQRRKPANAAKPVDEGHPVSSPMTGIYYASPSPGEDPFVQEGDSVEVGQVVGLIEAMKVFNEITATVAGTVGSIRVNNGELVQPGDPILFIK